MDNCYILCSGPSIRTQDLLKLNGTFVSISNAFVHKDFEKLDVICHIFGGRHSPITVPMYTAWFKEAEARFKSGMKVMIHHNDKHIVDDNDLFKKQEVVYFTAGGTFPNTFPDQVDNFLSISQIGLQYGIHTKPENVIMLGIDHSWVNHVGVSKHFYAEEECVLTRMGLSEWTNITSKEQGIAMEIRNLGNLSNIYSRYHDIAKGLGVNIFNGTPNSMVNSLPFREVL